MCGALTTASIGDSQSTREVEKFFRLGTGSFSQTSVEQDATHCDGEGQSIPLHKQTDPVVRHGLWENVDDRAGTRWRTDSMLSKHSDTSITRLVMLRRPITL